jgi:undecaprenyl-diphosphatase
MDQIITLDKELFLYLNGLGSTTWDGFWMFITGKWNAIPFYVFLLFLLYKKLGLKVTLITLVVVALMIACTDQLANLFKKVLFLRPRPCHDPVLIETMRLVKSRCGGAYGYFSAHAASSMALAVFLGKVFQSYSQKMGVFLLIWALFVGYSRIYIGVHYPGDVLTGILFGVIIGLLSFKLHRYLLHKFVK